MASFFSTIMSHKNTLAIPLWIRSSFIKEFVLQFGNRALNAIIDTLVIEFNQAKYEEFLCNNSSLSPSKSKTISFCKTKKVGTKVKSSVGRVKSHVASPSNPIDVGSSTISTLLHSTSIVSFVADAKMIRSELVNSNLDGKSRMVSTIQYVVGG